MTEDWPVYPDFVEGVTLHPLSVGYVPESEDCFVCGQPMPDATEGAMSRGVPLFSQEGYRLCNRGPTWHEQHTPQEEARMDAEQAWWDEHDWLLDLPEAWGMSVRAQGGTQ